jgi:hypothetical protein
VLSVVRRPASRGSTASEFIGRSGARPSSGERCVPSIASCVAYRASELRELRKSELSERKRTPELRSVQLRPVASEFYPSPKSTLSRALHDLVRTARLRKSQRIAGRFAKSGGTSLVERAFEYVSRAVPATSRTGAVSYRVN